MKPRTLSNQKPKKSSAVKKLKKPDHISYSQIETGQCLYKYKMIRLLKKIHVGGPAMTEGSMVHQVIYEYTKKCVEERIDSDFELIQELINKHFKKSKLGEGRYIEIRDNLLEFAEKGVRFDTFLDFEKKFNVELDDGQGSVIDGIIDRVNCYKTEEGSAIEFIDYKNQRNIMTEQEVSDNLQLKIYKYIGCDYLYPSYDIVRVGIYHTMYNYIRWSPMQKIKDLSYEFEGTRTFLNRQHERLLKTPDDQYLPQKGEACWKYGGCDVMKAGLCPLYTDKEINRIKEEGSVEDKVRIVRKLDIERASILSDLKTHFKDNDNIEVDGKKVGYVPSVTTKYDLLDFKKFADRMSVPLTGISISKTDAEKAIKKVKKLDELEESDASELEQSRVRSSSTSFKYS